MTSNPPPPKEGQAQIVFPDIDETTMQQRSDVLCFLRGFLRDNAEFEKALNYAWSLMKDCPKVEPDSSLLASHERLKQALAGLKSLVDVMEARANAHYDIRDKTSPTSNFLIASRAMHDGLGNAYNESAKLLAKEIAALSLAPSVNNG